MIKDPLVFIRHMLLCLERIQQYTKGFSEEDFLSNSLIQDATIRNFEIIGEATKNLSTEFRE